MKLTINQMLELINEVNRRTADLKSIRGQVTTKETRFYGENQQNHTTTEPQYDVKAVDAKVTQLETFLFKAKSAIKQVNATTTVDLDVNVDQLLEPIK
jgi:hypothetical protein